MGKSGKRSKKRNKKAVANEPTPFARMIAMNLGAAERIYRQRITEINSPVIALLRQVATDIERANGLADFLAGRRLSEIETDDFRILGEMWEQVRESNSDVALMSWADYVVVAGRESEEALAKYHDQVQSLKEYGKSMSDKDQLES